MKYREPKYLMVLSIQGKDGKQVEITRSNIMEGDKVLELGKGGTRCYFNLPDLSIYNTDSTISVDLYQLEKKVIEL